MAGFWRDAGGCFLEHARAPPAAPCPFPFRPAPRDNPHGTSPMGNETCTSLLADVPHGHWAAMQVSLALLFALVAAAAVARLLWSAHVARGNRTSVVPSSASSARGTGPVARASFWLSTTSRKYIHNVPPREGPQPSLHARRAKSFRRAVPKPLHKKLSVRVHACVLANAIVVGNSTALDYRGFRGVVPEWLALLVRADQSGWYGCACPSSVLVFFCVCVCLFVFLCLVPLVPLLIHLFHSHPCAVLCCAVLCCVVLSRYLLWGCC